MSEKEDIIRKIRQCFALGDRERNPSEHEAEAAINTAKRLMAKHNLSMAEVALDSGDALSSQKIVNTSLSPRSTPPRWELELPWVCAHLFDVSFYYRRHHMPTEKTAVVFVGYEHDVAIAIEVFKLLKMELLVMGQRWAARNLNAMRSNRFYYTLGVVDRLRDRARQASSGLNGVEENTCRAIVVSKEANIKRWIQERLQLGASRKLSQGDGNIRERHEGYRDGEVVSLNFAKAVKNVPKPEPEKPWLLA